MASKTVQYITRKGDLPIIEPTIIYLFQRVRKVHYEI